VTVVQSQFSATRPARVWQPQRGGIIDVVGFACLKRLPAESDDRIMSSLFAVLLAFAYLIVLVVLGMVALRKCPPEDVAEVLRALFGRK
jgi:hypothetical protein